MPDPFALGLSMSWTAWCLLAAAVVCIPELPSGRWPSAVPDRILALYLVVVALTSATSVNHRTTWVAVLALLGHVGMFYAARVLARNVSWLTNAILLSLVASIALLLLMALAYHAELGLLTRPEFYPVPRGWSGHPELSMLAAIQFGLLIAALQAASTTRMALATASLLAINLVELVFLYSRASGLAVSVIIAAAFVLFRRTHLSRLLGIVGVVAVAGLVFLLANPTFRFLTASTVGRQTSAWARDGFISGVSPPEGRIQIWQAGLRMIADHPGRGLGLGTFEEMFEGRYNPHLTSDSRQRLHAHNLWLQQCAELGLIGGALYAGFWVTLLGLCWRSARDRPTFASVGLLLSIVGIAGSNVTTNMFYLTGGASGRLQSLTWMLFGLAAALPAPKHVGRLQF